MRKAKGISILVVLFTLSLIFSSIALGNYTFFSTVQQICSNYGINVSYYDMDLRKISEETEEFILPISSTRGNYDKALLVGFYSAGKAMLKCNLQVEKVTLVVSIKYKGMEKIFASATKSDIMKFINNELSSHKFLRNVNFK
ncbi:MAG: hypothetical protein KAX28_00240 [Candidatus Marinimicrobia bacterium]|nr:hypothetical protein [Candidatus Neomarinimicrobiota bacterium]